VADAYRVEIGRDSLLARERIVCHNGAELFRTPLLVPSFSSKGFPEMKKIIALMREFITGAVLVSAYDEHYGFLASQNLTFPSVIFLDSGGYEARVEHDLSESYGQDYKPKEWKVGHHRDVIKNWRSNIPTILVSYDSPAKHSRIEVQVRSALKLKDGFPQFPHELLIKPERKGELLEVGDTLPKVLNDLGGFAAVGFTEYELDEKIIGRMLKIAEARKILDQAGLDIPIHIFGSLDTFSTALYFLSGAEIFDGLTWLRFGFFNGQTIYKHNYGAMKNVNGLLRKSEDLSHSMWKDNYYYLEALREQMRNFISRNGDYTAFLHIGKELEDAMHQLEGRI
jgi:hypothetical protein